MPSGLLPVRFTLSEAERNGCAGPSASVTVIVHVPGPNVSMSISVKGPTPGKSAEFEFPPETGGSSCGPPGSV